MQRAIVDEAARREAEVIILGASRAKVRGDKPIFERTVDLVLRNSPTRVAVIAGKRAAWSDACPGARGADVGLGLAVDRTAAAGGDAVAYGYLFGALLVFAGALRLYLLTKLRRG